MGTLQINFQFNKAEGDIEPSYQTAIWLEDIEGHYVKTLFLSEYLSYGGYNDSTICPAWNSQSDWDNAPMEAYDAVTRATPPLGEHLYQFGLDSLDLTPGDYFCNIQVHLIEDYNILFKNKLDISTCGETTSDAIFEPGAYSGAEMVLAQVIFRIDKN